MKIDSIFGKLAVLAAVAWSLLPIYWTARYAFLSPGEVAQFPPPLFLGSFSLAAFYNIAGFDYVASDGVISRASGQSVQVLRGLRNSLIVATTVMIITVLLSVPLSYAFARLNFKYKNVLLNLVLFSVALPPVSTIIPFFTMYITLGLSGTLTGLIIVNLTLTIPFVTWMLVGYFRNLPSVENLARIDGYSRLGTLLFIIVPIARSGIGVAAVIAFLLAWNEFTFALVLVNGTPANTLSTAISGFLFMAPEPSNLAACVILSLLPPILIAFVLQRNLEAISLTDPVK